jgi:hypothetical protein
MSRKHLEEPSLLSIMNSAICGYEVKTQICVYQGLRDDGIEMRAEGGNKGSLHKLGTIP